MKNDFKAIPKHFYARPTLEVATELLGCTLNRSFDNGVIEKSMITEVEAYTADDPACHAYKGLTKRNQVLFGEPGMAYVYFIYGMYHCLNVVTEVVGVPGAILIRGLAAPGMDGPGKICRQWKIDRSHNGIALTDPGQAISISARKKGYSPRISVSKRIGISQTEAREFLWRFFIETKDR
jgi:DNA-3-methyladenine glycosylase